MPNSQPIITLAPTRYEAVIASFLHETSVPLWERAEQLLKADEKSEDHCYSMLDLHAEQILEKYKDSKVHKKQYTFRELQIKLLNFSRSLESKDYTPREALVMGLINKYLRQQLVPDRSVYRYFKWAAKMGNVSAECERVRMDEWVLIKDKIPCYEKLAAKGCSAASLIFAVDLYNKHDNKCMQYFEKAAMQSDPRAFNGLGYIYALGQIVPLDYPKAREYLEKAAEFGHADAIFNLGELYEKGDGVEKDIKKAARCFRLAMYNPSLKAHRSLRQLSHDEFDVHYDQVMGLETLPINDAFKRNPLGFTDIFVEDIRDRTWLAEQSYKKVALFMGCYDWQKSPSAHRIQAHLGFYELGMKNEEDAFERFHLINREYLTKQEAEKMDVLLRLRAQYETGLNRVLGGAINVSSAAKISLQLSQKEGDDSAVSSKVSAVAAPVQKEIASLLSAIVAVVEQQEDLNPAAEGMPRPR